MVAVDMRVINSPRGGWGNMSRLQNPQTEAVEEVEGNSGDESTYEGVVEVMVKVVQRRLQFIRVSKPPILYESKTLHG